MKPNKKDKQFPPNNQPNKPAVAAVPADHEPLWRPTWQWHGKVLAGIYVFLAIAYFAVSAFLSRVPPPYRLRDIPKDITPWIK